MLSDRRSSESDSELIRRAIRAVKASWTDTRSGIVGAALRLPNGDVLAATSLLVQPGIFQHAEPCLFAMLAAGGVCMDPKLSELAITLTPCANPSRSRAGESCLAHLRAMGFEKVLVGAHDPRQPDLSFYEDKGLIIRLVDDREATKICTNLAGIFERFGDSVNSDIGRVKRLVGLGVFDGISD